MNVEPFFIISHHLKTKFTIFKIRAYHSLLCLLLLNLRLLNFYIKIYILCEVCAILYSESLLDVLFFALVSQVFGSESLIRSGR